LRDFELVIVDNGDGDELRKSIQSRRQTFPIQYVRNLTAYKGYTGGIDAGVRQASGKLLLILNPDTRLPPDSLKIMADQIRRQPSDVMILVPKVLIRNTDVINSIGMRRIRPAENVYVNIGWRERDIGQYDSPKRVEAFDGAAFMLRRELLKHTYVFDPRFFFGHDSTDLAERVQKLGFSILTCPDAIVRHEVRATAAESNDELGVLLVRNLLIHTLRNMGWRMFLNTLIVGIVLRHLILPILIRHRNIPGPVTYATGVIRFFFDIGKFNRIK
jgi:hypothetical protein